MVRKRITQLLVMVLILLSQSCIESATNQFQDSDGAGEQDDQLSSTVTVKATGAHENSTLGIPRYKVVQSMNDQNRLWLGVSVDSGADVYHSSDAGMSWEEVGTEGWEMHLSVAGDRSDNLHFINRGAPGEYVRLSHPASGEPAFDLRREIHGYDSGWTSGNIVAHDGELVIFTRNRNNDRARVKYFTSTDEGHTWSGETELFTPKQEARFGSAVIDDRIGVAVWKKGSPNTINLYLQDGASFKEDTDTIDIEWNDDMTRQYSVAQTAEGRTHVVWVDSLSGTGLVLRHSWKQTGSSWSAPSTIVPGSYEEMFPLLSAHGDALYLVYLENYDVYLKRWDYSNGWSEGAMLISDGERRSRYAQVPQQLNDGSDYLPIIWTEGTGDSDYAIRYRAYSVPESPQ